MDLAACIDSRLWTAVESARTLAEIYGYANAAIVNFFLYWSDV